MMDLVSHPSPSFLACKNGPQSIHCRLPQGVNKILQGQASDREERGPGGEAGSLGLTLASFRFRPEMR